MSHPEDDDFVRRALARLRDEPLDDEFSRRLHVRLAAAPAPEHPGLWARLRGWLADRPMVVGAAAGASVTAVAGLLLFAWYAPSAGVGLPAADATDVRDGTPPSTPAEIDLAPEVFAVPVGRVAVVQFHIESDVTIPDARIRIDLPEGLSFYDRAPEERGFVLATELGPGETPIPLAVRALEPGRHVIRATASVDGVIVRHRVVLEVAGGAG